MSEIILDLGPVNAVDEIAFAEAIERFVEWQGSDEEQLVHDRDAPDLMIKTVCDTSGTLRKAIIFQKQEWAAAFLGFWDGEQAA
jgi:hypothetical protein